MLRDMVARGGIEPPTRHRLGRRRFIGCSEFWRDYYATKALVISFSETLESPVDQL
jgi:hypothetical protein